MTNPYAVLGVSKTATQDEIKKAYRNLAKKNHPDLNPGNKKAEEKFKEISHANDLIGTEEARAKFDRGETDEQQQEQQRQEWQRHQNQRRSSSGSRSDRYSQSFADQFGGEDFFEELFRGQRSQGARSSRKPDRDIHYQMPVSFQESIIGSLKVITLANGKNLQVKIPPGITSGTKLRFKNQGTPGPDETTHGDAYIEIKVEPLIGWSRIGNDIETEVSISFIEAILGAVISVPTMYGPVMLNIPSGVNTGSKLRIKGKGVIHEKESGNQIVKLKVVLPKTITPEMRSAISNIKGVFDYNPRGEI